MNEITKRNGWQPGTLFIVPKSLLSIALLTIGTGLLILSAMCYLLWRTQKHTDVYSKKVDNITTNINVMVTNYEHALKKFEELNELNKTSTLTLYAQLVDMNLRPIRLNSSYVLLPSDFRNVKIESTIRFVDSTGRFQIKVRPNELTQKSLWVFDPQIKKLSRKIYGKYDPKTETMLFVYPADINEGCECKRTTEDF